MLNKERHLMYKSDKNIREKILSEYSKRYEETVYIEDLVFLKRNLSNQEY